jgi:hypothetical protein
MRKLCWCWGATQLDQRPEVCDEYGIKFVVLVAIYMPDLPSAAVGLAIGKTIEVLIEMQYWLPQLRKSVSIRFSYEGL